MFYGNIMDGKNRTILMERQYIENSMITLRDIKKLTYKYPRGVQVSRIPVDICRQHRNSPSALTPPANQ